MPLDLEDIKSLHDKAYNKGDVPREQASDDLVFAWVTQWDDNLLGESQLQYRGEFNILRKAMRQIMSDLRANPVSIDFSPKAESRDDGADFLDGLYRTDDRYNRSIEAYDNAMQEAVVCGIGGWILETEYESNRGGNMNQVIRRRPIYEFNNTVFFDPNAKLMDKSDAKYCSVLWAYSPDGYEELVRDLTGRDEEVSMQSFDEPEQSYTFPWLGGTDKRIHVVEFYHKEMVKDQVITLTDPLGDELQLLGSDLLDVMDDLLDTGHRVTNKKDIERWQVTKYIASGIEVLSEEVIAGECVPVIPVYGERAYIEGEEYYEGITRLAKDPQRLRNFQMSYLADIVSRSPRPKPIFNPEQIQGFEDMYEENGADNNYPYLLQNRMDQNGNPLPTGPVAQMPEQPIPQALIASLDLTRQAVEDVANPGLPQDIADPDLSGKAVIALQNRVDQQSMVFQQNGKHAKRRDAEIYASMATIVYDAPRQVTLTAPDGYQRKGVAMEMIVDKETGMPTVLNDITNMEFDVFADVGPSYSSMREQTFEKLSNMIQIMDPGDPARRILQLEQLSLIDGINMDDIRKYARNELILPRSQAKAAKTQADIENNQAKTQIDAFDAQTRRLDTQVAAERAGAEIQLKRGDQLLKRVESAQRTAVSRLRGTNTIQ